MTSILLFTGTQYPLPVRYPRPTETKLVLPPLIHRSLHTALDASPPSAIYDNTTQTLFIPHPDALTKHDSSNDSSDDEVTAKIHLIGSGTPSENLDLIKKALHVLAVHKGLAVVDVALIGLEHNDENEWESLWRILTGGAVNHVKEWGTLYASDSLLSRLCEIAPPSVNELDLPDCHTLPKQSIDLAHSQAVQLWAGGGGEGSDILPVPDLNNLLHEFESTITSILGSNQNPSCLLPLVPVSIDGSEFDDRVKAGVTIEWILSYAMSSRTRNIVKDKGYIVSAKLLNQSV